MGSELRVALPEGLQFLQSENEEMLQRDSVTGPVSRCLSMLDGDGSRNVSSQLLLSLLAQCVPSSSCPLSLSLPRVGTAWLGLVFNSHALPSLLVPKFLGTLGEQAAHRLPAWLALIWHPPVPCT